LCILRVMTRAQDKKFGETERADTAYVGAGRPCKALLGRRVRKSYVHYVVARTFTTSHNGASLNFTARNGVGVSEDAAQLHLPLSQSDSRS